MKFIIGYDMEDIQNNDINTLVEYKSVKEADYNAEEWVLVEADTLEEAKEKYEECFLAWQNENNL